MKDIFFFITLFKWDNYLFDKKNEKSPKKLNNPLNVFKVVSKVATTVSDGIQGLAQDYNSFFVNNNYKELNEIYNIN